MSTHDEIEELADLAAAGAWEPDAHATSCASCTATLTAAREFRAWASGAITPDAPPADLEERLIARFRATNTAAARRFRLLPGKRVLKWASGAAAAVGLVLLGSSFAPPEASLKELAFVEADFRSNDHDVFWENGFRSDVRKLGYSGTVDGLSVGRELSKFNLSLGVDGGLAFKTTDQFQQDVAGLKVYNEALDRDKGGKAQRGSDGTRRMDEDQTLVTKLEVDAQVADRQLEVKAAHQEELAKSLEERPTSAGVSGVFGGERMKDLAQAAQPEALKAAAETASAAEAAKPLPVQAAQKLVRNATIGLEVASFEETQAKLTALAAEEKGYIAGNFVERLQNGKARATVELRVPSDRFDVLLGKVRALGTVKTQSVNVEDMTKAYADVETRLAAKLAFADRLRKLLTEGQGKVEELLNVEKTLGATLEEIDRMKGELRFYDNRIAMSTFTLEIAEKDLGQPFEYVQTLRSIVGLVTPGVDAAYAAAQKIVLDAGGQVVDSKMTRQNDGAATGTIRARVEAAKFPGVREALRNLDHIQTDTVDQQKTARGGEPTSAAPVRVEQATIDLTVTTPALLVTRRAQLRVETKDVEAVYLASRKSVEKAGGRVLDGGLSNRTDGGSASLTVQVDVDKFAALVEAFKASGEVKHAVVNQSAGVVDVPARERAEVILQLQSPPALIGEDQGIGRTVRETFARSWTGLLWSVEKLFVGLSLGGPWLVVAGLGWLGWRRARRRKPAAAQS